MQLDVRGPDQNRPHMAQDRGFLDVPGGDGRDGLPRVSEHGPIRRASAGLLPAAQPLSPGAVRDTGDNHWPDLVIRACLQNGVRELWSADRDFERFPVLRTTNPLVAREDMG